MENSKISYIQDQHNRQSVKSRRVKNLIKKAIELSFIADLKIFVLMQDDEKNTCVHYTSHPKKKIQSCFNQELKRYFFSNADYY